MKKSKMYKVINFAISILCIVLIVLLFIFKEQKILIGVLLRGSISLFIIYNAVYIIFTNNPTFMLRKWQEKHRKVFGVILLLLGIFVFVTVILGYGINGYPLLDWRTVL